MIESDVLVIGGGPAGLVVAQRALDAGRRVTIAEAGPGPAMPSTITGIDLVGASQEQSRLWPELRVRDRIDLPSRPYRQARTLGGGSVVNGMVLSRGLRRDYQRWEQELQCRGWGADDLLPWLDKAAARFIATESTVGPLSALVADRAIADGLTGRGSTIDLDAEGVLRASVAATDQQRVTALDLCKIDSATVLADSAVSRLVVVGRRAVGAELANGQQLRAAEIVLCAGALGTPAILRRSSIANPRVGGQIVDHWSISFDLGVSGEAISSDPVEVDPATTSSVGSVIRFGSSPDRFADIEVTVVDRFDRPPTSGGVMLGNVIVALVQPASVGYLRSNPEPSDSSLEHPFTVVTNGLSHAHDRSAFRAAVRRVARWLADSPLTASVESLTVDRIVALSDDELDHFLLSSAGPVAHLAGSCPLGPESSPVAVCHAEPGRTGSVIGYEGLRIADSSALPGLISGGLQLPVMAVADRVAADLFGPGE